MRLIDADNLVEKVERARTFVFAGTGDRLLTDGICDGVIAQINVEPTVDAVPVVRCKDCRYFIDLNCYVSNFLRDSPYVPAIHRTGANDFCSHSERRQAK